MRWRSGESENDAKLLGKARQSDTKRSLSPSGRLGQLHAACAPHFFFLFLFFLEVDAIIARMAID